MVSSTCRSSKSYWNQPGNIEFQPVTNADDCMVYTYAPQSLPILAKIPHNVHSPEKQRPRRSSEASVPAKILLFNIAGKPMSSISFWKNVRKSDQRSLSPRYLCHWLSSDRSTTISEWSSGGERCTCFTRLYIASKSAGVAPKS